MDTENTIISAKFVIESLLVLLENENVDISSIEFKVGSQEGYESENISFESLVNLTLSGLNEAKDQAFLESQQALNDRLLIKSIKEHVESHIYGEISINDLFDKGWLAAMLCIKNNIDTLETAQEQNELPFI